MLFTWIWFPIFGYSNALYTFYCSLGVAAAALFLAFGNYFFIKKPLKSVPLGFFGSLWNKTGPVLHFQLQSEVKLVLELKNHQFHI